MPSAQSYAYSIANTKVPPEGPKAFQVVFDLTATNTAQATYDYRSIGLSQIQSVLIDNSRGAAPVSVEFSVNFQVITIPANTQAFMPVLMPAGGSFTVTVAGNIADIVVLHLINVAMDAVTFSGVEPSVLVSGSVTVAGLAQVAVQSVAPGVAIGIAGTASVNVANVPSVNVANVPSVNVANVPSVVVSDTPAQSSIYNLSADSVIKASPGRLYQANMIVAGGACALHDCATIGAASIGNQIAVIPNAVGTVLFNDWNFGAGLVFISGGGGSVVSCSYR